MNPARPSEIATLAGGCFWCMEAVFTEVEGVEGVRSGYTGGTSANPTYQKVCSGGTGHAEAVQITFDPDKISYTEILEVFFSMHDPTTLNRQGPDTGTQYRSAIFYHNQEQRVTAEELISHLNEEGIWQDPIVTQVVALDRFYPAEDYHREYFARHAEQAYCQMVISPKVNKLRERWAHRLKAHEAR